MNQMSLLYRRAHSALHRYKTPCYNSSCRLLTVPSSPYQQQRSRVAPSFAANKSSLASVRLLSGVGRGGVVCGTGLECVKTQSLKVADVLQNVRAKMYPTNSVEGQFVVLEGEGRHLGLSIKWELRIGPDGAFVEKFNGEKISWAWGSAGVLRKECWETDYSGISRLAELDDFESCVLTTWLRSGQWLHPSVLQVLHIEMADSSSAESAVPEERVMSSCAHPTVNPKVFLETDRREGISSRLSGPESSKTVDLIIRLKTGKVKVTARVDRSTWLPVEIGQDLFGDRETWFLKKWQSWGNSKVSYPTEIIHTAISGGHHQYTTKSGRCIKGLSTESEAFEPPEFPVLPPDYEFDTSASNLIPAWKTLSCHILVKPRVDGKDVGYMILDTGASGLVMEKATADALELEVFGELYVSGVSGKVPAHFRRAKSLVLGPLTLRNPQFMEMPVPGLVAGACSPVVGIIGYDVFRRAIIEMKPTIKDKSANASEAEPNFIVKLYDLERFLELPKLRNVEWFPLHMITNLPHINAQFSMNGTTIHNGLFMLDTGAGGASVMFMSRAATEYGLQNDLQNKAKTFVKGVGGSQTDRLPVKNGTLSWFELQGKKHGNVSCLFIDGTKMDISVYACGILCMNLLQDSKLIIDYARRRMSIIHQESSVTQTSKSDS